MAPARPGDIPRARRVTPPGGHPPVGAVLYVAPDGPHIVVALSPETSLAPNGEWCDAFDCTALKCWEAKLGADCAATGVEPAPSLTTGRRWDGQGLCIVQQGGERMAVIERWPMSAYTTCHITAERAGQIVFSKTLGIPGYNDMRAVAGPEYPRDVSALGAFEPSATLVDERVWLVTRDGFGYASVRSTRWGHFTYGDWAVSKRLGRGYSPAIVGSRDRGLFVSCVRSAAASSSTGRAPSTIALFRSTDGQDWKALQPVTDETTARTQALALDPEHGLCVVYAAKREGGWPLMAARSADFGQTWGKPVMLTERTIYASQPQVVAYGGRFYISYRDTADVTSKRWNPLFDGDPLGIYTLVLEPEQLPA